MSAAVHRWLAEPLSDAAKASIARVAATESVVHVAVMPDAHLAREVCVGLAVATTDTLLPGAVGGDIGCGMAAIAFDASADLLDDERRAARILSGLYDAVPALKSRRPAPLPPALLEKGLSQAALERRRDREGRYQLGTLGRGNHFVELQADEQDRLWAMVHTGSRGMGRAVRALHGGEGGRLAGFAAASPEGQAYLCDVAWALDYAAANRKRIVDAVEHVLSGAFGIGADDSTYRSCHHNHVRREVHAGRALWVHRKGAIPAADGEAGIIPGSMGSASFHTVGRGNPESLYSSSHGAGRRMSRTEARKRIPVSALRRQMRSVYFDVRRASALRDEAPEAYRDIGAVMRAQRDLTRVERRLRPLLSFKH